MLYRKGNQWELSPYKIKYTQYGEPHVQYASDKKWWLDFADAWEHTKIIEIIDVVYTLVQLDRYEDIKYMPEDFGNIYSAYVEGGAFPTNEELRPDHPFRIIQLRKENELLNAQVQANADRQNLQEGNLNELSVNLGNTQAQSFNTDTALMEFMDFYFENGGM
ncbi:hypothetical protein [Sporosarcina psychrophila]|uniref:DUF438 domain-containing protein n=1 Tax=Sporosarcina psychrophila TaxID=1476 RepID=A0ABV2KAS5_SPOPS